MAVKPIGINKRDIGTPDLEEIRLTTGMNKAAAPTFCIKEEIKPTVEETIGMILPSDLPPFFKINAATLVIRPVLSKPAPIIITAIMDITALEEKPLKSLLVSTSPPSRPISW